MRMYKQLAAIISTLVLAIGCDKPTAPSHGGPAGVDTSSVKIEDAVPKIRERAVVNLTDSAASKFKDFLAAEETKYIRLSVKHGGSTGFMYDLQIDDSINESDFVDRSHGFTLVVDAKSSIYLEGATIDWQTPPDGKAGFKFDNPNAVEQ